MTCPRCSGPTVAEQDQCGPYRSCLHCGWLVETGPPDTLPLDLPTKGHGRGRPFTTQTGSAAAAKRLRPGRHRQLRGTAT